MAETPTPKGGGDNILKKQIGPLPLGIWIIVVGGALVLAWYINARRKDSGSGPDEEALGQLMSQAAPQFLKTGPPSTNDQILTNEQWAIKAVAHLIGAGAGPYEAQLAVRKFLAGDDITQAEKTLIDTVLKAIGPPPILPTGGGVIPNPTAPPPSTPPGGGTNRPASGTTVFAQPYYNLYNFTAEVSQMYGIPFGFWEMRNLNPGIDYHIYWDPHEWMGDAKMPYFKEGRHVRIA